MHDFLEMACTEAEKGVLCGDGGPFGAVIVKDGKVIGKGHNCVLSSHDSTAHAEITAIRQAEQAEGTHDLTGCEIYVTAFPCPMCLGAIMWARISKLYYGCMPEDIAAIGFDDKAFYDAIINPESNTFLKMEQYDIPQCRMILEKWLQLDKRVLY